MRFHGNMARRLNRHNSSADVKGLFQPTVRWLFQLIDANDTGEDMHCFHRANNRSPSNGVLLRSGLKEYTRDKTQPHNVPSVGLIDRPMAPARSSSPSCHFIWQLLVRPFPSATFTCSYPQSRLTWMHEQDNIHICNVKREGHKEA